MAGLALDFPQKWHIEKPELISNLLRFFAILLLIW